MLVSKLMDAICRGGPVVCGGGKCVRSSARRQPGARLWWSGIGGRDRCVVQQREQALDDCLVTTRTAPVHRPEHAVLGDCLMYLLRANLRSSIAVQDATGDVACPGDGIVQGSYRQAGCHCRADRVPDDASRVDVLERAQAQLARGAPACGDAGQPQLDWAGRGEVSFHEVVVHRRAGLAIPTLSLLVMALVQPPAEQSCHAVRQHTFSSGTSASPAR